MIRKLGSEGYRLASRKRRGEAQVSVRFAAARSFRDLPERPVG